MKCGSVKDTNCYYGTQSNEPSILVCSECICELAREQMGWNGRGGREREYEDR